MNLKLRPWQEQALKKAIEWLVVRREDRHFLMNAAPASGKTLASCVIAKELFRMGEVDRVIVIAPTSYVVNQWAKDFCSVTGRHMGKVTASDGDISSLGIDVCATWAAVQGLQPELQAMCRSGRVLVICDEHHHAAIKAAWGNSADSAFAEATFVLVLSGTPIRSDGARAIWLAYDETGAISHPSEGTYTLTYGKAVELGYCRPVTFHRHEGRFSIDLENGEKVHVSGHNKAVVPPHLARDRFLQGALDFYYLARTPQFESDGTTPLITGFQATMLEWGSAKLTDLRHRMPNAGGLVIAPSIEMANYMAELLEQIEGERPVIVHSDTASSDSRINAFRNNNKRWLVSVAMVSEGVDIMRLRVLVYLPNALTELAFRQAMGRIVRTAGPDDDTRAYVVMPSFETFEVFARRVEAEMPRNASSTDAAKTKRCPSCCRECSLGERVCAGCGHEFPVGPQRVRLCSECGSHNPVTATMCHACGFSFSANFLLTLEEALRTGVIARGMDIDEAEVQDAEQIAPTIRHLVLKSGDVKLLKILQTLPEESWARLRNIMNSQ